MEIGIGIILIVWGFVLNYLGYDAREEDWIMYSYVLSCGGAMLCGAGIRIQRSKEKVRDATGVGNYVGNRSRIIIDREYSKEKVNEKIILIHDILREHGYKEKYIGGEMLWKKGRGICGDAMKYIKIEYENKQFVISGFIRAGILGFGGSEMSLDNYMCWRPAKSVLRTMHKIKGYI